MRLRYIDLDDGIRISWYNGTQSSQLRAYRPRSVNEFGTNWYQAIKSFVQSSFRGHRNSYSWTVEDVGTSWYQVIKSSAWQAAILGRTNSSRSRSWTVNEFGTSWYQPIKSSPRASLFPRQVDLVASLDSERALYQLVPSYKELRGQWISEEIVPFGTSK